MTKAEFYEKLGVKKEEYSKYRFIAEINGVILARDVDAKDFCLFGTMENFEKLCFPEKQCGKMEDVLKGYCCL